MQAFQRSRLVAVGLLLLPAGILGCQSGADDVVGAEEAAINPTPFNALVRASGLANPAVRETSAAFLSGPTPHWVVAYNYVLDPITIPPPPEALAGWAWSTDASASMWTSALMGPYTAFGALPSSPATGKPFSGWGGDPAISAVTDPTRMSNGSMAQYTNIGMTYDASGNNLIPTDVVVAWTNNGGTSTSAWQKAAYVNTPASSGGETDNPVMATNPASPWGTYVAWTTHSETSSPDLWIRLTRYSSTGIFDNTTVPIKLTSASQAYHPSISVGNWVSVCGGPVHETVFIAYVNGGMRCNYMAGGPQVAPRNWSLLAYDTISGVQYGPFSLYSEPHYHECVGDSIGPNKYQIDNDPRPRLAVDTSSSAPAYWGVAHMYQHPQFGSRIMLEPGKLVCSGGSGSVFIPGVRLTLQFCPPGVNNCDGSGYGYRDGGGNAIVDDEWGPAIAFAQRTMAPAAPRFVLTWETTRDAPGPQHLNATTDVYMAYSENDFASVSVPTRISTATWDQRLGLWHDYQAVAGSSDGAGSFVAAWGGDTRTYPPNVSIYSDLLQ